MYFATMFKWGQTVQERACDGTTCNFIKYLKLYNGLKFHQITQLLSLSCTIVTDDSQNFALHKIEKCLM